MTRSRALVPLVLCLMLGALAPTASGATRFRPRIGGAMGLVPPAGSQDIASGAQTPTVYHAGSVMTGGVTVHTIFWAPAGYQFQGPPPGALGYEDLIKQFFVDSARDSGTSSNVFSVLPQFAQGTRAGSITPGAYSIAYSPSTDAVDDSHPYPSLADQCASPSGTTTCVTDAQIQAEVDRVVQSTPGTPRGLHNLWYVFLPPNVDECILPGSCGTNAFGGYHSLSNVNGHGVTIYAVTPDPLIETTVGPGSDPQGNPDAEVAVDVAAHETEEAMTDPEGVGWMDPNGFESADKCEVGPQHGTPLGFAPNGSPYNQIINGHQYWLQEMWSNNDHGCVQRSSLTANPLPLPQVNLTQFGSTVTGNIGSNAPGVGVRVSLQRANPDGATATVASSVAHTAADGSWSASLGSHAVGDDRDQITVDYSGAGAPAPNHQVILTGNGGNPFTESGWTGWFDMDNGSSVTNNPRLGGPSVTLGPCFQNGVLAITVNGTPFGPSPTDFCNTQTDVASVSTPAISPATTVTASSNDNRAFSPPDAPNPNLNGGLVTLTVAVGEPDSASLFLSPLATFTPSGFPSCTADLQSQRVSCEGLVPGRSYGLSDGRAQVSQAADDNGTVSARFRVRGLRRGDSVSLSNGSRTLTTLHVAQLRASITENQTVLSGGSCQPGAYYGAPLSDAPTNRGAGGPGVALSGEICPLDGRASGLSSAAISQTDERSGGQTQTEVPEIENTSPLQGETLNGSFRAIAQSGLPGPNNSVISTDRSSKIALSITPAGGGRVVFHARNVDSTNGVFVRLRYSGTYKATWTLRDLNGDTRTVRTRFVELGGRPAPHSSRRPKAEVSCSSGAHGTIKCAIAYANASHTNGTLALKITSGAHVLALGRARLRHGRATVRLHRLRAPTGGAWMLTLVLTQPNGPARTTTVALPR